MICAPSMAGLRRVAGRHAETPILQVAHDLGRGLGVDVIEPQLADPAECLHGQRLELRLCAVADQGHGVRAFRCQILRHQCRSRGGAQRRQQGHFRQQHGIARMHVRQQPEGRHGLQAVAGILRVAVDVLEAIDLPVRRRHQLNDTLQ